jgi:hypothetical protein
MVDVVEPVRVEAADSVTRSKLTIDLFKTSDHRSFQTVDKCVGSLFLWFQGNRDMVK